MAVSDRSNTIVNVTDAAKNFANLVRPQVTDTSTSGTAHDNAQADELIKQLMARGNDASQFQPLIDSIMQRAAISFAPILGEQVASGGYNSTALKQLAGESQARATGEAASAVTAAQQEALRTAASLQSAKLQTNQNRTAVQKPPTSIGELLKGIGISYAAAKGIKKLEGIKIPGFESSKTAAEASDAGFLPGSSNANYASGADDFGFYSSGGGSGASDVAGSSFGAGATSSELGGGFAAPLSSEEVSFIMGTSGDAAAANAATFAGMTDSSVPAIADAAPGIYGDFGTLSPAGAEAGAATDSFGIPFEPVTTKGFTPEAIDAVPLGDSAIEGAAAGSDVLSAASSQSAIGGAAAASGDASAIAADAGGIDAGLESVGGFGEAAGAGGGLSAAALGPLVAIPIAATVASEVGGGLASDIYHGVGDIAQSAGDAVSGVYHGLTDASFNVGHAFSNAFDDIKSVFGF